MQSLVESNTSSFVPKFVKPDTSRHLCPHKSRAEKGFSDMPLLIKKAGLLHHPHRNLLVLQIKAQKLPHHIQRRLARMMAVIPTTFTLMPQRD